MVRVPPASQHGTAGLAGRAQPRFAAACAFEPESELETPPNLLEPMPSNPPSPDQAVWRLPEPVAPVGALARVALVRRIMMPKSSESGHSTLPPCQGQGHGKRAGGAPRARAAALQRKPCPAGAFQRVSRDPSLATARAH